jgi:hypothetical protein
MTPEDIFPSRGCQPGLHALIVGVSDYPNLSEADGPPGPPHHLGLHKLGSAATAAVRLYSFLVERADHLAAPLASCRLLLSPSPSEAERLTITAPRANLTNFAAAASDWRRDARTDPKNVTLFYFAGHGLQRSDNGQVLLFEDFGGNEVKILQGCLEASNLLEQMGSTHAADPIARTQLYFFDACRTLPAELLKYDGLQAETIWDPLPRPTPGERYLDNRLAPVFYTEAGNEAFGVDGVGSIFGESLLGCLQGGAGVFNEQTQKWSVSVNSLCGALTKQLTIINRKYETDQTFRVSETGPDKILHNLDGPPRVHVEITLHPADKRTHARILIRDETENGVSDIGPPVLDIHREELIAGTYDVCAVADARQLAQGAVPPRKRFGRADPPFSEWSIHLA